MTILEEYNDYKEWLRSLVVPTYDHILTGLNRDKEIDCADIQIRRLTCEHKNTTTTFPHDSHYTYENVTCDDCDEIISSEKV